MSVQLPQRRWGLVTLLAVILLVLLLFLVILGVTSFAAPHVLTVAFALVVVAFLGLLA